jgi:pimeloyl-ACP methyl ester carboxylesterase
VTPRRLLSVLFFLAAVCRQATAAGANPLDAAPSRFAALDGYRVHYKSLGTGRTALVFIHGWTCDLTFFREQVPAFDRKTRMILVDLPGHGKSDKPQVAYTMDFFARAVDSVLRDAGISKAILIGHSMGTPVARQFYRLHPKKTLGIVALDMPLRGVGLEHDQAFIAQFTGPDWKANQTKFIEGMFSPATTPALKEKILGTMTSAPHHVMASAFKEVWVPAVWKDDPIGVPVLALCAPSPFWTAEYEAGVKKFCPDVRFVYVDGAGHFLQLEKPAEVNAALLAFLKERGWIAG